MCSDRRQFYQNASGVEIASCMELQELVVHRVNDKADRYAFWLRFFNNPMFMMPGILAAFYVAPNVAVKHAGMKGLAAVVTSLLSLATCALNQNMRSYAAAQGVFWHPVWTAFCSVVQCRKESKYERLYTKPMNKENEEWVALVERESVAFDNAPVRPTRCVNKEEWVALRTIEFLLDEGEKAHYWE
jgi:hypothetical protein